MAIIDQFPSGGGGDGIDISGATVTLDNNELTYDGTAKTKTVTSVVLNGITLTANTNYIVAGNIEQNIGTYILRIIGIGNYTGVATAEWEIEPNVHIYGVSWDKTSSTSLTRTDDSADFADPIPALSGGTGGSPFDELMPWAGMVKETFADGNVMVKIPKFWYKWTDETNSLKLQIADYPAEGFHVSPAHADRGDSKGERDYVYIGRYHCDSNYKSTSGVKPIGNITRATARTSCKNLGTGYYQLDYAMLWTIRMLYLVEFADWNSQAKIGYGCGNGSAKQNNGSSDTAQYHTGTMQSSRDTYGVGIQYRYIEDPWANVEDWCDGIYITNTQITVPNNISGYYDYASGTKIADHTTGSGWCISGWTVPSVSGFEWALWPKTRVSDSTYSTYVADYLSTDHDCLIFGGVYSNQNQIYGMFSCLTKASDGSSNSIGARLQYLP